MKIVNRFLPIQNKSESLKNLLGFKFEGILNGLLKNLKDFL